MVRAYVESDLDSVLDAWYRASLIAHPFLTEEFLAEERIRIAERWLPASETWVHEADGHVVAFLSLVGNEVGAIFVHPDHQGRGIGRALMDHARSQHPILELDVFEENPIGRRFYDAYGFVFVSAHLDPDVGHVQHRLRFG